MSAPHPIDTFRDAFLRFLADGKTHAEALEEFDFDDWNAVMMAEIEERGTRTLLDLCGCAMREEADARDMELAIELWLAGWKSEMPLGYTSPEALEAAKHDPWRRCPVMSWYWRRPSRRAGKPGRRYLSTNQAWRALQRERGDR